MSSHIPSSRSKHKFTYFIHVAMKKVTALFLAFLMSSALFAQNETSKPAAKCNELKINLPLTIFGSFPEISYERVLSSDISIGAAVGKRLADDYDLNFAITPYFRWFFGGNNASMQKVAAGFFIEANGALFTKSEVGAGLGLAIGWKLITKNNWAGEIFLGGGRDFINSDNGYPRVGISIGKRF